MARFWWERINPTMGARVKCCVEGCDEKSECLHCDNAYRSADETAYCLMHAAESGCVFAQKEMVSDLSH
jgi:hypothetical protein